MANNSWWYGSRPLARTITVNEPNVDKTTVLYAPDGTPLVKKESKKIGFRKDKR